MEQKQTELLHLALIRAYLLHERFYQCEDEPGEALGGDGLGLGLDFTELWQGGTGGG